MIQQTVVSVVRMVPARYREQWGLNQLMGSEAPGYSGGSSETVSGDGNAPDQQGKPQAEGNQQQMTEQQKMFQDMQQQQNIDSQIRAIQNQSLQETRQTLETIRQINEMNRMNQQIMQQIRQQQQQK
jgi:hypothetical protein